MLKQTLIPFIILLILGFSGCRKSVEPEPETCYLETYATDLSQAKTWFVGEWKLTQQCVMLAGAKLPDVKLIIDKNNQITVIENEKQIDKVDYELIKGQYDMLLKTNAEPRSDNWYVRNPSVRISSSEIFLDVGMAYDGPGYKFKRVR